MDGGAWQATVHGVAESRTRLSNFTFTFIQLTDIDKIIYLIFTTCRSKPYNSKCSKAKGEIEIIVEKLLYYRYCLKEDCSKLKLILESPSESVKVLVAQSGPTLCSSMDYKISEKYK